MKKKPSLTLAFIPIITMLVLLGVGIGVYGLPVEPLILISAIVAAGLAMYLGYSFDEIMDAISEKIGKVFPALLILISVGILIGSWMIGGTIPMLIHYGLSIINPRLLAITAFIVTAIISLFTGTSWGSAGTIGVAFMGVAVGMDANLAMIAGAVVSGAYFGDKLSPLSDTTNLASIATGTDLYVHIKNQLWTTGPSFALASVVYLVAGWTTTESGAAIPETVTNLMATLDGMFNWNLLYLVPLVIVLAGAIAQKPTVPVMLLASLVALINGMIFEGASLSNSILATYGGFDVSMVGLAEANVIPEAVALLHRGGMTSMLNTILIVLVAVTFAAIMEVSGTLGVIIDKMVEKVSSTGNLILTTILVSVLTIGVTSNGQISILIPGEALTPVYKEKNVHSKILARTIEDSVSVIEPIMPWTSAGAFMASTLGVATFAYLPWAVLNYTGIIFALIWGYTGIGISKADDTLPYGVSAE